MPAARTAIARTKDTLGARTARDVVVMTSPGLYRGSAFLRTISEPIRPRTTVRLTTLDRRGCAAESYRGAIADRLVASMKQILRSLVVAGLAVCVIAPLAAQDYDLVILNGRVIDPESGLDAIRNIGVRAGTIVAISDASLSGQQQIDANGLVVAPGFIDLHSHGQTDETYRCQVLDGVTRSEERRVGKECRSLWSPYH